MAEIFQPTLPAREETLITILRSKNRPISTHSPREGRDNVPLFTSFVALTISTHSPREGRDLTAYTVRLPGYAISTHSPREGRDAIQIDGYMILTLFQPTLPAREETVEE